MATSNIHQKILEFVKQAKKLETERGIYTICKLYELSLEELAEIYKEIRQLYLEIEIENDLLAEIDNQPQTQVQELKTWIEILKQIARDIKDREEKAKREKELEVLKSKINQIMATKLEQELMNLTPEELQKLNELIEQGFTLEEALQIIRNSKES